MKITQEPRPHFRKSAVESPEARKENVQFQSLLVKENEKQYKEKLHRLLVDIEEQGEKLIRSQTVKDLQHYKSLIERFMKEAVEFGMRLRRSAGFTPSGKMESHLLVEEIDKHLLELTNAILEKGEPSINLMGRVGEIKGLLVNLYG